MLYGFVERLPNALMIFDVLGLLEGSWGLFYVGEKGGSSALLPTRASVTPMITPRILGLGNHPWQSPKPQFPIVNPRNWNIGFRMIRAAFPYTLPYGREE